MGWSTAAAITALACAVACSGDDGGSPAKPPDAAPPARRDAAPPKVVDPEYPANGAGLQSLLNDLLEARQAGDADKTYTLTESLRLRDYETWFTEHFGPKLGPTLAADYKIQFDDIQLLADTLQKRRDNGRSQINVERFEGPEDTSATGYQVRALRAMKPPVPLYSVRLVDDDGKKAFHIWSFIHDGKSFRYVGKMKPIAEPEMTKLGDLLEYRVVDAKKLKANLEKK